MQLVRVMRSARWPKKYCVLLSYTQNGEARERRIWIGQQGAEDFTMHGDPARKQRYLARHRARENWGISGVLTAGFWARWLLWNKPTLRDSIIDVRRRFAL